MIQFFKFPYNLINVSKFCFYVQNKTDRSALPQKLVITSLFFRYCIGQWPCHRLFICWKYCLHGKFISLFTELFLSGIYVGSVSGNPFYKAFLYISFKSFNYIV